MSEQQQPQVITLDNKNSIEILSQYIDVAQKNGSFALAESEILKRCKDLLIKNVQDAEINLQMAKQLFIQAIHKGQQKGSFSLDDSYILHRVCTFITQTMNAEAPQQAPVQSSVPQVISDDLNELSQPVPLKSTGPRTI